MRKYLKCCNNISNLSSVFARRPTALAIVRGEANHSTINGVVRFYKINTGVIVASEINGLPYSDDKCKENIFAMHIHSGEECTGNINDPFANAMTHYNPENCEHPQHAGDMPPLFGNGGYAFSVFFTDRFSVEEIIGRTVIIHDRADDFHTQPAGNSGSKIACGQIKRII